MAFAQGRYAKAISDRSGMEFPYNEMVKEWTGALVHISEFEPKQPQLQPPYHRGDPQALLNPRPDRKQLPTSTLMGANPFTTNGSTTVTVFQQDHGFSANDIVRFMDVNISPIAGLTSNIFNLEQTLGAPVLSTATTITLSDASDFPSSGYIFIRDVPSATNPGQFVDEVIRYQAKAGNVLQTLTRGTSAPFFGVSPATTTARDWLSGTKVFGGRAVTPVIEQRLNQRGVLENFSDKYTFTVPNAASGNASGGGFPIFVGPVSTSRALS
tara:strand:- start:52 stop:858 length:807 start_codon:yes stop_codon:yes gene_type:complete